MAISFKKEVKELFHILNSYVTGRTLQEADLSKLDELLSKSERRYRFVAVSPQALSYAVDEVVLRDAHTFSFNIKCNDRFITELSVSSNARRRRFGDWYNPIIQNKWNLINPQAGGFINRFRLDMVGTSDSATYHIQCIKDGVGRLWPVAVIAIYANSINSWSERVGLRLSRDANHHHLSTHYITQKKQEYVFFNSTVAMRFLPEVAARSFEANYNRP